MNTAFHKVALLLIVLSQIACVNYEEKYKSEIGQIDSLKSSVGIIEKEMTLKATTFKESKKDDSQLIETFSNILPDTVDEQAAEKLNEFNYIVSLNTSLVDTCAYYRDEIIKLYKSLNDLSSDFKNGAIDENRIQEYIYEEKTKIQNIANSIPIFDSILLRKSLIFEWASQQIMNQNNK